MQKEKGIASIIYIVIIVVLLAAAGFFAYKYFAKTPNSQLPTSQSNSSSSSSNSEIAGWKTYTNTQYGFELNFPESWKGYTVSESLWQGWRIDDGTGVGAGNSDYNDPIFTFNNPKNKSQPVKGDCWQDIPIMVITPDVWQLIAQEKIAVSAAPIGPAKIGENAKYVFATPPRWAGFKCSLEVLEAYDIIKTFKVIK